MATLMIVATAFGSLHRVRQDGHHAFVDMRTAAGAAAFEVRRELFAPDAQGEPAALAVRGRWSVYSTDRRWTSMPAR